MENKDIYLKVYNDLYFDLWEMNLGQGQRGRAAYKGARLYGQFLMSEIDRYSVVERSGETTIERRGLVSPMSVMRGWAYNVLEDCHQNRVPPPMELCSAMYTLMGCTNYQPPRGKMEEKQEFYALKRKFPDLGGKGSEIGLREAARRVGVDKRTIERWNRQENSEDSSVPPVDWHLKFSEISEITNMSAFLFLKYRAGRT